MTYALIVSAALGGILLFLLAVASANTSLFAQHYEVAPLGNWEGRTILRRTSPPAGADVELQLADDRRRLFERRRDRGLDFLRVRPGEERADGDLRRRQRRILRHRHRRDRERARQWVAKGANLSPTVQSLLERPEPAPAAAPAAQAG